MEAWLRLANLQISARAANLLLDRFGSPEALFSASLSELADVAGVSDKQAVRIPDPSCIPTRTQIDFIERSGTQVLTRNDARYPQRLLEIVDPPPVLFIRGEVDEKDRFAVAIVGSRHSSPYGRTITAKLARELAQSGLTIVSGGALGIDIAAHRAVVESKGRTLVVLGCGLDVDYPRENRSVFEQIVQEGLGALITEFPPGSQPE